MLSFYRVGLVFCGRQSPGGHNVIWGLHKALKIHNPNSTLLGFLGKLHFLLEVLLSFFFFLLHKSVCMFVIASDICVFIKLCIYTFGYISSGRMYFFFYSFSMNFSSYLVVQILHIKT